MTTTAASETLKPDRQAETYEFDRAHSEIGFTVRHMVINNVRGQFTDFAGTIQYDPADLTRSSVDVTVQAASIDTREKDRDKHLRSADFLEAEKFPEIRFRSHRVEKQGDAWVAVGDFTLHGVTREVAIPFSIIGQVKDPWGLTRLGLEAGFTINRRDFGVSWSALLDNGGLVAGNEVKIILNVEAVRK